MYFAPNRGANQSIPMKTVVLALLSSLVFLTGCNTLKETQIELASGNYEQAIRTSVESLRKSRTKKKSVAYIIS